MEPTQVFNFFTLILIMLVPHKTIFCMFQNELFEKNPISGTKLEVYENELEVTSFLKCAYMCLVKRKFSPVCQAFVYDPLDRTCDFYKNGDNKIGASNLDVFIYRVTDMFHVIIIDNLRFSIYVSSERKTFSDARAHCQDLGGYLIQFDHVKEYDALSVVLATPDDNNLFFVGANDIAVEGQWVTDRDNKLLDMNIWTFAPGSPDNYRQGEHCGFIRRTNPTKLADIRCEDHWAFVCERDF